MSRCSYCGVESAAEDLFEEEAQVLCIGCREVRIDWEVYNTYGPLKSAIIYEDSTAPRIDKSEPKLRTSDGTSGRPDDPGDYEFVD